MNGKGVMSRSCRRNFRKSNKKSFKTRADGPEPRFFWHGGGAAKLSGGRDLDPWLDCGGIRRWLAILLITITGLVTIRDGCTWSSCIVLREWKKAG